MGFLGSGGGHRGEPWALSSEGTEVGGRLGESGSGKGAGIKDDKAVGHGAIYGNGKTWEMLFMGEQRKVSSSDLEKLSLRHQHDI